MRFRSIIGLFFSSCIFSFFLLAPCPGETFSSTRQDVVLQEVASLPLIFEPNVGQVQLDPKIRFFSRSGGYSAAFSADELSLFFNSRDKNSPRGEEVRVRFSRDGKNVEPEGQELLPGITNYYIGNHPEDWKTSVSQFSVVRYREIRPGVDLVFYGKQRQMEFDFDVAPGADASAISLKFEGATVNLRDGNLVLTTPSGNVAVLKCPNLYQGAGKARHAVPGGYRIHGANEVAFRIGRYDKRQTLVIDPALVYSTLLGGVEDSSSAYLPLGIVVDSTGATYVTGQVLPNQSIQFGTDAFVLKFDPTGSNLVYATYVGGQRLSSYSSIGQAIVIDANMKAYIVGMTTEPAFPTTVGVYAPVAVCANSPTNLGCAEPFAAKLDAAGRVVYSTFLVQPSALDTTGPVPFSIAVDANGALYASGITQQQAGSNGAALSVAGLSTTQGAFQTSRRNNSNSSGFVLKLHPDGSVLDYATYLGGSTSETAGGMAVDPTGAVYVDGGTSSSDFPVTSGAFQTTNSGTSAFFSKLKPDGSGLLYSTFLGAAGIHSSAQALAVDANQSAYLTGVTSGPGFPTTPGVFKTNVSASGTFNFVSKFDSSGNLSYSTYVGDGITPGFLSVPSPTTSRSSIAVDSNGAAYIAGDTTSNSYPLVGSIYNFPAANGLTFLTKLKADGSGLLYSTLFPGGPVSAAGFQAMTLDGNQNVYLTGWTPAIQDPASAADSYLSFPTTVGAFESLAPIGPSLYGYISKITPSLGSAVPVPAPRQVVFSSNLLQGVSSVPRTIQLNNYGDADLAISSISIGGANPADFVISNQGNSCGATLPVGAGCSFRVIFTPTVVTGPRNATVNLSFGGGLSAQTVPLSGVAGVPLFQASPSLLDFDVGIVGNFIYPAFAELSLSNPGTGPLHLAFPVFSGPNASEFCVASYHPICNSSAFPLFLNPGQTVKVGFYLIPQAVGTRTAQMLLQTDGGNQTINLTGIGVSFPGPFLVTSGSAPGSITITAGQTATYNLELLANFSASGKAAMSCSGAPAGASCTVTPTPLTLIASQNFTVTVATTARTTASLKGTGSALWWSLALIFGVVVARPRKRRWSRLVPTLGTVALLCVLVSCGGGNGGGGSGGTPAGTYTLTVTGTATGTNNNTDGTTSSTNLTLIVQ